MESLSNHRVGQYRTADNFSVLSVRMFLALCGPTMLPTSTHISRDVLRGFQSAGARMRARPELACESEGENRTVSFMPPLNLVIFRAFLMVRRGLVNQLPLSRVRTRDRLSFWMCVSSYTVLRLVVLVIFSACSHKSAGRLWEARILSKGSLLFPSFSPSK